MVGSKSKKYDNQLEILSTPSKRSTDRLQDNTAALRFIRFVPNIRLYVESRKKLSKDFTRISYPIACV